MLTLFGTILSDLSTCLYSGKLKALFPEITWEAKHAVSKQVMMWREKKEIQKKQTTLVMSKEDTEQAGQGS